MTQPVAVTCLEAFDGPPARFQVAAVAVFGSMLILAAVVAQAQSGMLFPQPFTVEHHVVQTDSDGTTFSAGTVKDHYGGSWIVSERPDGSRAVIDFARREITEIKPEHGTYTTLSFDQLAELQVRLKRAEELQVGIVRTDEQSAGKDEEAGEEPVFSFEEREVHDGVDLQREGAAKSLLDRPSVQHLRVRLDPSDPDKAMDDSVTVDVWIDSSVRLGRPALEALARFEREVLSSTAAGGEVVLSQYIAAAREHAKGAFPVRTRRPASARASSARQPVIEDVVTSLEPQQTFPVELVSVPEGFRRAPHALEQMVAFAEEEAERNMRALSATARN